MKERRNHRIPFRSFDAAEEVKEIIESIGNEASGQRSFATKKSALETLRKIGEILVLAPSTLGSEVQKQFQYGDYLRDAMVGILESMSLDEKQDMAEATDEKGRFLDKVIWIRNAFDDLCVMDLGPVVDLLRMHSKDMIPTKTLI